MRVTRCVSHIEAIPQSRLGFVGNLVISKQGLLLFDGVVVLGLEDQIQEAELVDPQTAADAIYLAERGILHTAPSSNPRDPQKSALHRTAA